MLECRKLTPSLSAASSLPWVTEMLLGTGPPVGALAPPEISGCAKQAGAAAQSPAKMKHAAQARGTEWVRRISVSSMCCRVHETLARRGAPFEAGAAVTSSSAVVIAEAV